MTGKKTLRALDRLKGSGAQAGGQFTLKMTARRLPRYEKFVSGLQAEVCSTINAELRTSA